MNGNQKKKNNIIKTILIIVIIGLVAVWIVSCSRSCKVNFNTSNTNSSSQSSTTNSTLITKEKYDQIQTGMSYDQVVQLIGSNGQNISESEINGTHYSTYSWTAEDGVSSANISFRDNVVISKSQMDLE